MRKRYNVRKQHRTPHSEIKRLEDAVRREQDKVERESLLQQLEHWIRTQNNLR